MSTQDDQRVVTTTVAKLKAFEAAVKKREDQRYNRMEAGRQLDAAKIAYERAVNNESDAIDDEIAATGAMHEGESP